MAARAPSVSNDISTGGSLVCAAGKYCRAPRGTSLYGPGGEAPTHSCFNCNGPIHCVMFCGQRFCDLSGSVHVSLLSPIGRSALRVGVDGVDPYESERVMCLKCISDIKELVTNLQPDGNGITADGQEADLSILTGGADPAPSGEYAIYNCSWKHVMVTAGESNLVTGKKHSPGNLTKLKGFLVGDRLIEISKISIDELKKWVARTGGISRARKKKKKDLADAIVLYRAAKERQSMTGEHEVMVPGTNDVLVINNKRLLNVLFGNVVKPQYASRGKSLKRPEIENTEKTGKHHSFSSISI